MAISYLSWPRTQLLACNSPFPLPCPCRDTRQAQWHADVAIRAASPPVETAVMARCEALLAGGRAAEALSEVRGLTLEGNPAATGVLRLRARALYLSGMLGWDRRQAGHSQHSSEQTCAPASSMGKGQVHNMHRMHYLRSHGCQFCISVTKVCAPVQATWAWQRRCTRRYCGRTLTAWQV